MASIVAPVPAVAHEHSAPQDASCARYGCVYGHTRTVHHRTGPRTTTEYGTAHRPLPNGPDGRWFAYVQWPAQYDPARRAMWNEVAQCESGQRWGINTGNGYYGGLQFSRSTWAAYGGGEYAPYAHQAWPAQQIAVAERVLRHGHGPHRPQGRGAWPHCGRRLH